MLSVACGLGASSLRACCLLAMMSTGACSPLQVVFSMLSTSWRMPSVVQFTASAPKSGSCTLHHTPPCRLPVHAHMCARTSAGTRAHLHSTRAYRHTRMRERAPAFCSGSMTRYRSAFRPAKARFSGREFASSPRGPRHERMSSSMPSTPDI